MPFSAATLRRLKAIAGGAFMVVAAAAVAMRGLNRGPRIFRRRIQDRGDSTATRCIADDGRPYVHEGSPEPANPQHKGKPVLKPVPKPAVGGLTKPSSTAASPDKPNAGSAVRKATEAKAVEEAAARKAAEEAAAAKAAEEAAAAKAAEEAAAAKAAEEAAAAKAAEEAAAAKVAEEAAAAKVAEEAAAAKAADDESASGTPNDEDVTAHLETSGTPAADEQADMADGEAGQGDSQRRKSGRRGRRTRG